MLRGFLWRSPGTAYAVPPRHAFLCCPYSLASTPVSALISFSSLLSPVFPACTASILVAISRPSLASLCDSFRPVVLARHLRVFHKFITRQRS